MRPFIALSFFFVGIQLCHAVPLTSRDSIKCTDSEETGHEVVVSRKVTGYWERKVTYRVHKVVLAGEVVYSSKRGQICGAAMSAWSSHVNTSCDLEDQRVRFEDMNLHDNAYLNGVRLEKCGSIFGRQY